MYASARRALLWTALVASGVTDQGLHAQLCLNVLDVGRVLHGMGLLAQLLGVGVELPDALGGDGLETRKLACQYICADMDGTEEGEEYPTSLPPELALETMAARTDRGCDVVRPEAACKLG